MKLLALPIVLETSTQLGYPASPGLAQALGVILFIFTALYVYPRTSILGAVLLTAFLGGAVATHVRVDSPLLTHTLFGVYLCVFLWGGLSPSRRTTARVISMASSGSSSSFIRFT